MFTKHLLGLSQKYFFLAVFLNVIVLDLNAEMTQTQTNLLVSSLQSATNRTHGFASLPKCSDVNLASSFISNGKMTIHLMNTDSAVVNAVRKSVEASGQVGKRIYLEKGSANALPYADNFVDLILITNLTDNDLSSISFSEIQRTLLPGGKAFIGRALAEGSGLQSSALQSWISGKNNATVVTDAQGTWAVVSKANKAGIDTWTHRDHGPDNNPASLDTTIHWPFLLQFRVKPYNNGRYASVVTSSGRMFDAGNDNSQWPTIKRWLRAYRIYNGELLWTRYLTNDFPSSMEKKDPEVFPCSYSFMVAQDEYLYMMKKGYVLKLDGETGKELDTIKFDNSATGRVKWIAVDNNILYALAGDSALDAKDGFFGTTIYAYNLGTKSMVWTQAETGKKIDNRLTGISNGKIFYYVNNTKMVCRNSSTGALIWENNSADVTGALGPSVDPLTFCVGGLSGMLCSQWGIYICSAEGQKYLALSATNGTVLWTTNRTGNRAEHKLLLNTTLFSKDVSDHGIVDASTSQPSTLYNNINLGAGCGPISGNKHLLFSQAGGPAALLDTAPFSNMPYRNIKADCSTPTTLSNGLVIYPNAGCGCGDLHRGIICSAPSGNFQFDREAVESERLEKGPAWGAISGPTTIASDDWPTYRGNNSRTGSLAVTVSAAAVLQWKYVPSVLCDTSTAKDVGKDFRAEDEPTPAVMVGNNIYYGGSDGYVRCVIGTVEKWRFATGSRIFAAPTVSDGCVFVGSGDGYAYCIDASTGKLVWRFRAAPVDRRINLYGCFTSNWPVLTGVLVNNGKAFFAAGLTEEYGTHVYCVNATTGSIIWQNNTSGTLYDAKARLGFVPSGYMTIVGSKLFIRAHHGRNGIFDLSTGVIDPVPSTLTGRNGGPTVRGRDIAVLDNNHILSGGRLLFSERGERGSYVRSIWYHFTKVDNTGVPQYPETRFMNWATQIAPAFDNQQFFVCMSGNQVVEGWDKAKMISQIDSLQNASDFATKGSSWPGWSEAVAEPAYVFGYDQNVVKSPMTLWRTANPANQGIDYNGIALASNAVVVTRSTHGQYDDQNTWKWVVTMLDRTTGNKLWEAALPTEPIFQGITLGKGGTIIVTLRTGEIVAYGTGAVSVRNNLVTKNVKTSPLVSSKVVETSKEEHVVFSDKPTNKNVENVTSSSMISQQREEPVILLSSVEASDAPMVSSVKPACQSDNRSDAQKAPEMRTWTNNSTVKAFRVREDIPAGLKVLSVWASSSKGKNIAKNAIDRDNRTRWAVDGKETQWIAFDLGSTQNVGTVTMKYYSSVQSNKQILIETSSDSLTFKRVASAVLNGKGTKSQTISIPATAARYMRITFVGNNEIPSVYEVGFQQGKMETAEISK